MTLLKFFPLAVGLGLLLRADGAAAAAAQLRPPNVLFLAIDDLNDWIGPLRGHPQVKTPNLDRLAQRGVVFANAHCASPLCNPSRAAVFSGRHPFETGVYTNDVNLRVAHPGIVLLPENFRKAGYRTFGTGKLLHHRTPGAFDEDYHPEQQWSPFTPAQAEYTEAELPSKGTDQPRHVTTLKGKTVVLPMNGMPSDRAPTTRRGDTFDWGPVDVADGDMHDGLITEWALTRLRASHSGPVFLGVGYFRPHIPLFAPRKYFELYDGIDIKLPEIRAGDLDDLSPGARKLAVVPDSAGGHSTVVRFGQWGAAARAYLACISFVDAQIGRLIDALDASPAGRNTVIVLWGDHGWHLGEKEHWGKWTGWRRSTLTPLIVVPPAERSDGFKRGTRCVEPVSLLDLYPTLNELCGLPAVPGLSGQSLVPLLKNPVTVTGRHVLTTFDQGNFSVTAARWHYIRYADGAEELYDTTNDPHEWENLTGKPAFQSVLQQMAKHLPEATAKTEGPGAASARPAAKRNP